ncbi:MAG: endonuclease III [Spirochaetaceae bacterium]|nr:endonuclease III [Spirochaetaceae bacterium]MDT8299690.1 endonuclease III [Spirochaetaceae bacterium]
MSPKRNRSRLEEILHRLEQEYPDRSSMLVYENPFQLTAAVALSAQTTDAAVNRATVELFRRWPDALSLSQAEPVEVEDVIHSLGFFRQKAKNLIGASRLIMENFDGEIPRDMEHLTSLPGIGRKSANVIRAHLWNLPGIIVDTHFGRVCRRLGLTESKDPTKLEREISALLPEEDHIVFSMTANRHGRKYCKSRKPECPDCPLEDICPKYGVA